VPAGAADAETGGAAVSGEWLDRLALRFVGDEQQSAPGGAGNPLLGRRELLRRGAAGALLLAGLGGLDVRRAAAGGASVAAAAVCRGGSLAACYHEGQKTFAATLAFCSKAAHFDRFERLGCIVETVDARTAGRKACRSSCPQPKKKGSKGGKGGGGGGTTTSPGGGHTPTCGALDCATGDKCCPSVNGPICCAICCNKNGDGCGSSSSDCG
jgi:hypothetical protein